MDTEQIRRQSKQAYNQWCVQWREHAAFHKQYPMKSLEDFRNTGIGKAILCVANGYSLEENIEAIAAQAHNVDIICCDKTMGHLLDHGITPKFVLVCDANVSYEKYMEPWKDQLQNTILLQNVCGNPDWTKNGNWQDKCFYVLKDVLQSEREFLQISGCPNSNCITAGINVSNMMVVMISQCDNERRQNLMGYDKMVLIGYDYSWRLGGKYYAFDEDGGGKSYYMRHIYGLSASGAMIYASNNLNSAGLWLEGYVKAYGLPIVQCSTHSLVPFGRIADLEPQLKYSFRPGDKNLVAGLAQKKRSLENEIKTVDDRLKHISRNHYFAHLATL